MEDITFLGKQKTSKSVDKDCNGTDFHTSIAQISSTFPSVDS